MRWSNGQGQGPRPVMPAAAISAAALVAGLACSPAMQAFPEETAEEPAAAQAGAVAGAAGVWAEGGGGPGLPSGAPDSPAQAGPQIGEDDAAAEAPGEAVAEAEAERGADAMGQAALAPGPGEDVPGDHGSGADATAAGQSAESVVAVAPEADIDARLSQAGGARGVDADGTPVGPDMTRAEEAGMPMEGGQSADPMEVLLRAAERQEDAGGAEVASADTQAGRIEYA